MKAPGKLARYALMFQRQAVARQQTQALLADFETVHRQLTEYTVQVESLALSVDDLGHTNGLLAYIYGIKIASLIRLHLKICNGA